ncbi:MAG: tyrosine-type recombinase/integrase [Rudaea sp.]
MSTWIDKAGRRHVGIMVGGKRIHRAMPQGATSGDAKRIEAEIRSSLGRRSIAIPGDPPLTHLMAAYMIHADSLRSPQTAKGHAVRLGQWLEGYRASEARVAAAGAIRDMTGHYAAATINRSLGTLKKALKLAWDQGHTPIDYGTGVKRLPENNARTVYLSAKQVDAIASKASPPVRAAIWIALLTGMRRGEICKLRAEDIARSTLQIQSGNTKTLRTRTVPIVAALRPWLAHIPLIINFEGLKSGFRRAREAAGMPHVRFHDLRHSCASILLASGADLFTISKILGHANSKTTERYAHMQIAAQRKAMTRAFTPRITPAPTKQKRKAA